MKTLIENGVSLRQRVMFVVVGDKGRDQVRRMQVDFYKLSVLIIKVMVTL